jgi:RND family efflux transporter MFP subunit
MKQLLLIAVIGLVTFFAIDLVKNSAPTASRGAGVGVRALQVETTFVEQRDLAIELESFGNVEPGAGYRIHALVAGQVLKKSPAFKDGTQVSSDTVLLELDRSRFEVAVANARADYSAAILALEDERARAEQAERDWSKRGPDSKAKDYVLRKPHIAAAEERVKSAKTLLAIAELDLERTSVKAGFNGVIRSVSVEQGAYVNTTQELGSGFSDDYAELRLPVKASDLALLGGSNIARDGLNLNIEVYNTLPREVEQWPATFERVESSIDTLSQQVTLVARIDKPFSKGERIPLLPGQYVKAKIIGRELKDVVSVRNELIYQDRYVYVVEGESRDSLVQRPVEILHRSDRESVLKSGLQAGDELVTTVLGALPTGTRVQVAK